MARVVAAKRDYENVQFGEAFEEVVFGSTFGSQQI
jgi:hypothetical protein